MGRHKKYYPESVIVPKKDDVLDVLKDFHFPVESVTIKARTQKEAYEKLKSLMKRKGVGF